VGKQEPDVLTRTKENLSRHGARMLWMVARMLLCGY